MKPWECTPGPSYDCFSCNGDDVEEQDQCRVCDNIDSGTPRTASDVLESITLISYAYGGHGLFPETIREMQNPSGWPSAMHVTYAFVLPLYIVSGLVGFYAYGKSGNRNHGNHITTAGRVMKPNGRVCLYYPGTFANANINVNWPDNAANKVSIVANMLNFGYTLIISTLLQVLQVEIALVCCSTIYLSCGKSFTIRQEHLTMHGCDAGSRSDGVVQGSDTYKHEFHKHEKISTLPATSVSDGFPHLLLRNTGLKLY